MGNWRPMTWVIVIVNVLFLGWFVLMIASAASGAMCEGADADVCAAGGVIGFGLFLVFWAVVDVILGVIWLVTKPTPRLCPACARPVPKGWYGCTACGYDFRVQQQTWGQPSS